MKITVNEAAKRYVLKWDNGEADTFAASSDAEAKARAVEIAKESNRLMGRGGVQLLCDSKVIAKGAVPAAQGKYSTSYWSKDFKGFESKSEAVPDPEYSLEDWMDEWSGNAAIYLCGELPRGNYAPEFAEFPCALDIHGNWIPRTYYDAKEDPEILSSVMVGEQDWVDKTIDGNFRHPKSSYVVYNSQKVPDYALREIGEAIEKTIGFKAYFEQLEEFSKSINAKKRNAPRATWF